MPTVRRIAIGTAGGLGILLGLGWLGLQVPPSALPPYPDDSTSLESIAVPSSLPPPVARYVRVALGGDLRRVDSAVLTGRGRLRVSGITFPARLRFIHAAGRAYRHYIEATWFGLPLLRVNEWYRDGHARLELPFGTVSDEPKVDAGANLALWGEEAFWLPSVVFSDPRVRWESINATSARLLVPSDSAEDELTVTFDEQTGLLRRMEALRYRSATDEAKIPWRIEPLGWRTFAGWRLPSPVAVTWLDEGTPWLVMDVEDMRYNTDVSSYIAASNP
jgi:hypothetical protein